MHRREKTRVVKFGDLKIGGGNLVRVQSMTQTKTYDVKATVEQILDLEKVGCEIVRVAVPDMEAAKVIGKIKRQINIPLVADIHFQYLLALEVVKQGVDKVRINPGNIGREDRAQAEKLAIKRRHDRRQDARREQARQHRVSQLADQKR